MDRITVELLDSTGIENATTGARTCYNSFDKASPEKDRNLLFRLWNVHKHHSLFEHIVFVFRLKGFSRLCLQELARHRIASYSVKSTRYTLKELRECSLPTLEDWCVVPDGIREDMRRRMYDQLYTLQKELKEGTANDMAKYLLPEAFRTEAIMTINLRSFMNFYELRSDRNAHFEIRHLANLMYEKIPDEVKKVVS